VQRPSAGSQGKRKASIGRCRSDAGGNQPRTGTPPSQLPESPPGVKADLAPGPANHAATKPNGQRPAGRQKPPPTGLHDQGLQTPHHDQCSATNENAESVCAPGSSGKSAESSAVLVWEDDLEPRSTKYTCMKKR